MKVLVKTFLVSVTATILLASVSVNAGTIRFTTPNVLASSFQLNVSKQPLADVLKTVAQTTGITLHYANLSKSPISASCSEVTTQKILQCLLLGQADLVFRYAISPNSDSALLKEVWIEGIAEANNHDKTPKTMVTVASTIAISDDALLIKPLTEAEINELVNMAQSNDSAARVQALADLALHKAANNPKIRQLLLAALSDGSAEVRAQAVYALSQSRDVEAAAGLTSALMDKDASVRLMVVDSADQHTELLQQALNDSDETVRYLAAAKLEDLAKN